MKYFGKYLDWFLGTPKKPTKKIKKKKKKKTKKRKKNPYNEPWNGIV